jgi:hypothetical protein
MLDFQDGIYWASASSSGDRTPLPEETSCLRAMKCLQPVELTTIGLVVPRTEIKLSHCPPFSQPHNIQTEMWVGDIQRRREITGKGAVLSVGIAALTHVPRPATPRLTPGPTGPPPLHAGRGSPYCEGFGEVTRPQIESCPRLIYIQGWCRWRCAGSFHRLPTSKTTRSRSSTAQVGHLLF